MNLTVIDGDLLNQDVEVIVNPWNRNIIPWWLLIPQGVSGAIKKRGGYKPFFELGKKGAIPLGNAVETNAGKLTYKAIIHVAGISMLWISSEKSIENSVINAMKIVKSRNYQSVAFPLIGAGTGGSKQEKVLSLMKTTLNQIDYEGTVLIVRYAKSKT
ncbi:Appr-1-p processing enzyme family domain protein [Hyella patelloides LEGE 07179]|uniref:Appr-1-p processing enzyme family domain protein n=1 Tax=Hyella patelloides LEGE 07179 TaxID=945734 RepID=A0A563W137_9CYAN|nr:macro domain-containing protein [Hyella patelloides]VEP17391.1 Appr-1-p processing enzyme family domain protein [Hyella patelloides LEGE 07179]